MPPPLSWADLAGRAGSGAAIGVWGVGVEGRANLRRLRALGIDPVLVDDRGPAAGQDGERVLATGDGGIEALSACEVVVKSPGISRYGDACRRLTDAGVAVVGGLGLWLAGAPRERILGITGTKGKSTTTAIAGHLLSRWGYRVLTGGNIGRAPWDPDVAQDVDWWVIEVSSYQATDVAVGPPVVVVTSLHADHLDWHGDEATYQRDKLSLSTAPGVRVTVANGSDERLRSLASLLGENVHWVGDDDVPDPGPLDGLGLLGTHNRLNAELARVALAEAGVAEASDDVALASAAKGFAGLTSRLQSIGDVDGVEFVDDSLSTNVLPTLAAVRAFSGRRVALLVGGFDRGIDYRPLAGGLHERTDPTLVLTLFESGRRIADALADDPSPAVATEPADDLEVAVRRAHGWAGPDGVVLLSPAAPSFGRFADYRERAAAFAQVMRDIAAESDGISPDRSR